MNKSASMIFMLFRLTIIDRKGISRGARLSAAHAFCLQGILLCKKLSNKHHGSVIFRLITVYCY